jgi:selenocysteine-specific elongation factor
MEIKHQENLGDTVQKHLIMGTAGHVDHGKTTLIKALTGFDCDTHKQEKDRGITINLGFSHLDLPDGNSVGIVDVPGHADFIKTMVAGACGLDFVLLIIAADESIMPQTSEHLQIMELLGIQNGIIVLTKTDLVDEELLELAEEEVLDFVENSFLKNAPILKVSSTDGTGIEELINAIMQKVNEIPERKSEGLFRMYVDRVFTQEGFGTVMNGSAISGSINKNDPAYLLPANKEVRIRRLEHHGKEVGSVKAGDRASFNLVGFKQKDFKRGMVLSNREIKPTKLIDVKLRLFQKEVTLDLWSQVIFLLGTNRLMCRMHLLDADYLNSGESCLAQIYFPNEIITQFDDKFIIRNSSGNLTLGGGHVVDPYPLHHRRRREAQVEIVKKLSSGDLEELLAAEVRKTTLPITHLEIAAKLDIDPNELIEIIFQKLPGDIVFFQEDSNILLLMKKTATAHQNKILSNLLEFHKKNPLSKNGRTFKELLGIFGTKQNETSKTILRIILEKLENEGKIRKSDKTYIHTSHKVEMDSESEKLIEKIENLILNSGYSASDMDEILDKFSSAVNEKKLLQFLKFLQDSEKIVFIQKKYLHTKTVNKAKKLIIEFIEKNEAGITVAQFRDMIAGNRSSAILLMDYMDNSGITIRKGNNRFLTRKFKEKNQL